MSNNPRPKRRIQPAFFILGLLAVGLFVCIIVIVIAQLTIVCCAMPPTPGFVPAAQLLPTDTRQIAFMSNRDGNWEIYEMTLGTRAERNLTSHAGDDAFPSYSADGGAVTFVSSRDRAETDELTAYMMNADGSDQRRVVNDLATILNIVGTGRFNWDYRYGVDGNGLLISLRELNLEVYGFRREGDTITEANLSQNGAIDWFASLSPDGSQIAFTSDRDGNQEIYAVGADGENLRRITDEISDDLYPVWLADGRHILFYSEREGNLDGGQLVLYMLDMQAVDAGPVRLSEALENSAAGSVYSRIGGGRVFMAHDGSDWEIYYAVGSDTEAINLTDNDADDIFAVWR
ncbi:MAG: PD40 domain-containing protein [Anaerolineae bacterium]|nr:PD40 domain-containing protein [Anaerolineae bacterium]